MRTSSQAGAKDVTFHATPDFAPARVQTDFQRQGPGGVRHPQISGTLRWTSQIKGVLRLEGRSGSPKRRTPHDDLERESAKDTDIGEGDIAPLQAMVNQNPGPQGQSLRSQGGHRSDSDSRGETGRRPCTTPSSASDSPAVRRPKMLELGRLNIGASKSTSPGLQSPFVQCFGVSPVRTHVQDRCPTPDVQHGALTVPLTPIQCLRTVR